MATEGAKARIEERKAAWKAGKKRAMTVRSTYYNLLWEWEKRLAHQVAKLPPFEACYKRVYREARRIVG